MELMTLGEFRATVDAMRGQRFPLLTHGGITLIDAMGGDRAIVDAARTTSDISAGDNADDVRLIRYLMRHRHTTPIEFCEVRLLIECPMDLWRQWIRHRTATVNEFSSRYSVVPEQNEQTPEDGWRLQSKGNRQGSSGQTVSDWPEGYYLWPLHTEDQDTLSCYGDPGQPPSGIDGESWREGIEEMDREHTCWAVMKDNPDSESGRDCLHVFEGKLKAACTPGAYLADKELELHGNARGVYNERVKFGVANEQARKDLLLSQTTRAHWKIDLHNLLHFLSLRMDSHAQWEIRQYANVIGEQIVAKLFPATWQAFLDYRMNAVSLTALDVEAIRRLLSQDFLPQAADRFTDAQPAAWQGLTKCSERDECVVKLKKLGLLSE